MEPAGANLFAGFHDRVRLLGVEQSELLDRERGRLLDAGERADQVGIDLDRIAGDREVLDGAQRMNAVVGVGWYGAVTEKVVLDAGCRCSHELSVATGEVAGCAGI
jgi:hypothetical protein